MRYPRTSPPFPGPNAADRVIGNDGVGNEMEQTDLLKASAADLPMGSLDDLAVTLDLGELVLDSQISDSFDDLIRKAMDRSGNLVPLRKCRHLLREGGRLRLTNPHPGAAAPAYRELQEILLRTAGFTDFIVGDHASPLLMEATRRPGIVEEQEYGMVVREIINPQDLAKTHDFARDYYFYKDFNYDLEVARQFDLHTHVFAVYDKGHQMVALSRSAMRVPGYNCPFMYAVSDAGEHYRVPDHFRSIGEVCAIYKEGRDGVFAYKRLMEFIVHHLYLIALPDSIWTTYEVNDPFTGNLYKNKFKMEEMGVRLTYRDFGGKWNLLCTDKMLELHALHHNLFRK